MRYRKNYNNFMTQKCYLVLLKEKWDGTIKAQGCMDVQPQRAVHNKRRGKFTHSIT